MRRRGRQPLPLHLETVSCITFTPEDMQVKGKHDRPLYYTGYIGSSEVSRIQVDPRSALSIMPPQGHAIFGDPYPPIKRHSDNHL